MKAIVHGKKSNMIQLIGSLSLSLSVSLPVSLPPPLSLSEKIENIVGKGENSGYQHFLL